MKMKQRAMIVIAVVVIISVPGWLSPPSTYINQAEAIEAEMIMENRQIIGELSRPSDIQEKIVDEALERETRRMKAARFIPVVVTAYNAVGAQTDSTPEITASNKRVKSGMVALSRDIEEEFNFRFGDTVVIKSLGAFTFEDRMNKRWKRRVDIFMPSEEAAKNFGVLYSFLLVSD